MRISLRTKLIVFGLLAAIIPLMIAVLPSIVRLQSIQQDTALEREKQIADLAAQEINHFLELQFQNLQETGLFLPEILSGDPRSDLLVERILFKNDSFVDVSVVDAEGREVVRKNRYTVVREHDLVSRVGSEGYDSLVQDGHYISNVYFEDGKPFFTIGSIVSDASGETQGGLFAEVDARILQQVVSETTAAKLGGRAYIVDGDGTAIAHPNISTMLARADLTSNSIVANLLQGDDFVQTSSYINEEGEEVLGSWSDVTVSAIDGSLMETDWHVVSEESVGYALRHVREMIWFAVGALVFAVILMVPSVLFVSNHILVPIEKVHRFVRKVGEGDFTQTVSVSVKDEIGDMAQGFNDMVESLKKARERDKLISDMKSEFLSIAAHQLRTPLSAINWTFQMIIAGDVGEITPKQKKFLERGSEANRRVIKLVNDLLNVSRIEEGKFGYSFTDVSLESIVEKIAAEEGIRADQKQISLEIHKPTVDLPKIKADEEKITLAVTNLIENALKYTPDKGRVDVFLEEYGDSVLFKVADTGIGISDKDKEKLFTKFFRGENAMKSETDGNGMGLFLVKNIIEAHGGKMWVESEEGSGSTFFFTVPISE